MPYICLTVELFEIASKSCSLKYGWVSVWNNFVTVKNRQFCRWSSKMHLVLEHHSFDTRDRLYHILKLVQLAARHVTSRNTYSRWWRVLECRRLPVTSADHLLCTIFNRLRHQVVLFHRKREEKNKSWQAACSSLWLFAVLGLVSRHQ